MLGTYAFTKGTVQVLKTQDDRILWTCDCDKYRRQSDQREPLWCKHIAKAAARRSLVPPNAAPSRPSSDPVWRTGSDMTSPAPPGTMSACVWRRSTSDRTRSTWWSPTSAATAVSRWWTA